MVLCMLPLAVSAYVFKVTRKFAGKVALLFIEIGFYMVGLCAFSACCVQIMGAYVDRFVPFIRNPLFFLKNLDALEQVLCGPGVTGLIFLAFFLILFAGVISDFMKALSGGAGGMGSNVRGAGQVVKKAANGAKMLGRLGINSALRMKDKKAARNYMNAPKGSKEWKEGRRRMEERGYLAKGKDGKLQTTKAFDHLTENDRMRGPFKGVRRLANNIQDIHRDMNTGVVARREALHDHSKGANEINKPDNA